MKIKKIILGEKEYDIHENINIISGYTNTNKTVLFYAIEFLFCIDSALEINNAIEALGCSSIKIIFFKGENELVVEREFDKKFKGFINGEFFNDVKKYKKELALEFNFREIYVDNNNQKNQFFLKDYLKMIMIPEEQLTSIKNIFERNGELDKNKMIKFFTYMLTGKTMKEELIVKKTRAKKSATSIRQFITAYNRIYGKPLKSEKDKYNLAIQKASELSEKINAIEIEIHDLNHKKNELEMSNIRLNTLINSYEEDMKSFKFAKFFESIEELIDDEIDVMEYEYFIALNDSIKDIKELFLVNEKQIKKINKTIMDDNEKISSFKEKLMVNQMNIEKYKQIIQYNQMLDLLENMTNDNGRIMEDIVEEIKQNKDEINREFKSNLSILCVNIKNRLLSWGIQNVDTVSFNNSSYDFEFDNTPIKIQPKGEKSIFSLAVNIEIILLMKSIGLVVPNFLIIDSCWVATDLKELTQDQIKGNIIENLSKMDLQIIIFENEDRKTKISKCNYVFI